MLRQSYVLVCIQSYLLGCTQSTGMLAFYNISSDRRVVYKLHMKNCSSQSKVLFVWFGSVFRSGSWTPFSHLEFGRPESRNLLSRKNPEISRFLLLFLKQYTIFSWRIYFYYFLKSSSGSRPPEFQNWFLREGKYGFGFLFIK